MHPWPLATDILIKQSYSDDNAVCGCYENEEVVTHFLIFLSIHNSYQPET